MADNGRCAFASGSASPPSLLIAVGSVVAALIVTPTTATDFHAAAARRGAALGAPGGGLAALSVGQLASAAAFFQAEGDFNRHEFDVDRPSSLLRQRRADRRPPSSQQVPTSERRRLRTRATASRSSSAASAGPSRRGDAAGLLPGHLRRRRAAGHQRPLGYDLGSDPERGPYLLRARDTGQPRRPPSMHAADRRHRDQRLPAGLPRRRADRDRGPAPRGADRLRRRRLPGQRPRRGGDRDPARRRRRPAAGRRRRRVVGPPGHARRRRPRADHDRRPHLAAGRPRPRPARTSACRC